MEVDEVFVKRVARAARLNLSEEEIRTYPKQMKEVLDIFSIIDSAPTDEVKPSFHPIPLSNVAREDIPMEGFTQEEALSLSQHKKDGYFKGPKAID